MRKIIQICESTGFSPDCGSYFNISALCDDGTVWYLYRIDDGWHKYPDIPQSSIENELDEKQ